MSLSPGGRIGPYEVIAPIGRGGMGEVCRARDGRLQRDVAIKALPAEFRKDAERLARFEREARLLASLNHPNIAVIYGVEETEGASYLILECVEGETLAERLVRGPLPVEEAIAVCAQIASGLEGAHEAGVIHRDLKPANVKIRPDGTVKVLDFGLAKSAERAASSDDQSRSPTISARTASGIILGTAAYMSPEQARGKPLDKRSDIWSFGCVLYETLSGKQAFRGDTVSDTLASILRSDPDWSVLPPDTPARVRDLLRRCLQKDSKRRLHDIADARIEIEEASATDESGAAFPRSPAAFAPRSKLMWGLGGALAASAVFAGLFLLPRREPRATAPIVRAVLPLRPGERIFTGYPSMTHQCLAISPDGRTVVFGAVRDGVLRLFRRPLDGARAEPIQGTEEGYAPFFSPDGQWLGFFTGDELKKVPLSGGTSLLISRVPPVTAGGSWGTDGRIVFTPQSNGALAVVPETGGQPKPLTRVDSSRGEHAHLYPQILPGGRGILFTLRRGRDFQDTENSSIAVLERPAGKWRTLLEGASYARYGAGRLVFVRGASVFSVPFDPSHLHVTGPAVVLEEDIAIDAGEGIAHFDVSPGGTLAFVNGTAIRHPTTTVVQLDRRGREQPLPLPPAFYGFPRLSPDGKRLALVQITGARVAISVYDRQRGMLSTLTPEPGRFFCPVWSPDGKRLAMTRYEATWPELCTKSADGSGEIEALTGGVGEPEFPNSWSPDGKVIAFTVVYTSDRSPTRKMFSTDIWLFSLEGRRSARPWFETPFRETAAVFSPDGKWIAYVSDESGFPEVYVRPYPGPGAKVKISSESGIEPTWCRGGRELLYRAGTRREQFMAAEIRTAPEFAASKPRVLFSADLRVGGAAAGRGIPREDRYREYDVSPDGNQIIGLRNVRVEVPDQQVAIVTNWAASAARP